MNEYTVFDVYPYHLPEASGRKDSDGRILLYRDEIKDGDVVAFDTKYGRGVAIMQNGSWFHKSYNYYPKHDNLIWTQDLMPDDIQLYAPTIDDMKLAIDHLFTTEEHSQFNDTLCHHSLRGMDVYISSAIRDLLYLFDKRAELQERIIIRYNQKFEEIKSRMEENIVQQEKDLDVCHQEMARLKIELEEKNNRICELEAEVNQLKGD